MSIKLRIPEEEMGRFLLAYYRKVFGPLKLGQAFLFYYGLMGFEEIRHEVNDESALDLIKDEFVF
jgi:hypothetical protein